VNTDDYYVVVKEEGSHH